MKISHNWLQTYFEEKIPTAEKLAELFTFHFCEVEGISRSDLDILDLKILPDRAHYALSHKGVAVEVSLLAKMPIKQRFSEQIAGTISEAPTVKIDNSKFCRRYIARIIEVGPRYESLSWLKTSLESIGQRSINPIVDATNYVMYDIGQPLHAFDADKVKGSIVIRSAKEGEKITLLDGREIILTSTDNVIADDEGPLVVAGAKGGKRAEISETTKRIIIESANFDPTAVRRTSTKYDIRSDSSKRFENEITSELAIHGMNNFCALIKKILPDARFGPIVDEYPVKPKQTVIEFDPEYLEQRLGMKISLNEARDILARMSIGVIGDSKWTLTIPFERFDLVIREDIVEEIGRVYGYEHIQGILPPKTDRASSILPAYFLTENIRNNLVEQGFSEVSLYTLVEKGDVEVAKPLARDKAFARKNLVDGMMVCVEKNALNADLLGLEAIKVFEIGHVFSDADGEKIKLAIGAVEIKKIKGLKSENIVTNAVKLLATEIGTSTESILNEAKSVQKGNSYVCEIDLEEILKSYKLPESASYKDLNFAPASNNRYQRFSQYPFIVRDIAVFVPESIADKGVWEAIEKGISDANARDLLVRHSLFDVFKKEGKISYAFRLIFQSIERTLTDNEVNDIMTKINAVMKEKGWEVR